MIRPLAAVSLLTAACTPLETGPPPPAYGAVLEGTVVATNGLRVAGADVAVAAVALIPDWPWVDTVGSCIGYSLPRPQPTTSDSAGVFSVVLVDYDGGHRLCASVRVVKGTDSAVVTLPLAPFGIDPTYGRAPHDTVRTTIFLPRTAQTKMDLITRDADRSRPPVTR